MAQTDAGNNIDSAIQMASITVYNAANDLHRLGKESIHYFASGDEQRMMLMGLKRFTKSNPTNTIEMRRAIAGTLIEADTYCY